MNKRELHRYTEPCQKNETKPTMSNISHVLLYVVLKHNQYLKEESEFFQGENVPLQ